VSRPLESLAWPFSRASEAAQALVRAAGLDPHPVELPPPPASVSPDNREARSRWFQAMAGWLGVELEEASASYPDAEAMLAGTGPALLELSGGRQLLVVLGRRGRRLRLLGPELDEHLRPLEEVHEALCREVEALRAPQVEQVLERAVVPAGRKARARAALLRELLSEKRVEGCWLLRLPPGSSFLGQARHLGLSRLAGALLLSYVGQSVLLILSWWLLGRGALRGRLDTDWLVAWVLMLLTLIPLRLLSVWSGGRLAILTGALLKRRLLAGALRLDPETLRRKGAGQFLGQVLESNAVERLAISGGLVGVASLMELLLAMGVLQAGAGGWLQVLMLALMSATFLWTGVRYYRTRRAWTARHLEMTHDLVERMTGHRTRLIQEPRERWHAGEDGLLERYLRQSARVDGATVVITTALPYVWLLLGLLGLSGSFIAGAEPEGLAVALGGVLFAYQALRRLARGLTRVAGAAIAWEQVRDTFMAATRSEPGLPSAVRARPQGPSTSGGTLVEGSGLTFRYPGRSEPVLSGCDLRIARGERVLLEGPSGGGKSTLGAMLAGLRVPDSGLLLVSGLDRWTLGLEGWRERIVAAPQFHENHVLTGTFAFNLLMGRGWPAEPKDLREADTLCRGLALGALLDRMPGGLLQMVGETGWQLSHGERSRLYIARALLQGAELIVLDESFAALDPDTLRTTMDCVLRRAPALVVIAHP
jgi:ATP-binding cassette, subfamily B, bacterial